MLQNILSRLLCSFIFMAGFSQVVKAAEFELLDHNPINDTCATFVEYTMASHCSPWEGATITSPKFEDFDDLLRPASGNSGWDGSDDRAVFGLYASIFSNDGSYGPEDRHIFAAYETLQFGRVIRMTGEIAAGDEERLAALLDRADVTNCITPDFCPHSAVLSLNSLGGNLQAALKLADLVRARQLVTLLEEGSTCASACVFPFFAGFTDYAGFHFPRRFAHVSARIGLHQPSLAVSDGQYNAAQLRKMVSLTNSVKSNAVQQFLAAGIDMLVLRQMYDTPPERLSWLNRGRMARMATLYGSTRYRGAIPDRRTLLDACVNSLESGGVTAPMDLLRNLHSGSTSFATFDDALDFACFGTKLDTGEWLREICHRKEDCTLSWCTGYDGFEECPLDVAVGPDLLGEYDQTGLVRSFTRLSRSKMLAHARTQLLWRKSKLDDYELENDAFFLSSGDAMTLPEAFCGEVDFRDPQHALTLQIALNAAGFDTGTPDGILGAGSMRAVKDAGRALLGRRLAHPTEDLLAALAITSSEIDAMRLCSGDQ